MSQVATCTQSRRHGRVRTRLVIHYGVRTTDHSAFAESISEAGLHIDTNDVFEVGTRLILRVEFPERVICHRGEVTWCIRVPEHMSDSMVCGMGIRFLDPAPRWPEFFRRWKATLAAPA